MQLGTENGVNRLNSVFGDEKAKSWLPNEHSNECMICEKAFNLFRRKHHCRSCGGLVCGTCSPDKLYVAGYKDQKVRVCKDCALQRQKRQKEVEGLKFTSATY